MNRRWKRIAVGLALWALALPGCKTCDSCKFHGRGDLPHYYAVATQIEVPDVESSYTTEAWGAGPPPTTAEQFESTPKWDLTLREALETALSNSTILRRVQTGTSSVFAAGAAVPPPPDQLLRAPESMATTLDPAIQETNPAGGFGGIGVEAALSAFDAQFETSVLWSRSERPINTGGVGELIFARDFVQDQATFQAELSKTAAAGTRMFVRHNLAYDQNNNPTRGVPSQYDVNYEVGFSQPLLRGFGAEYNRIAGPNAIPGVYSGVLIARINNDITLAEFEAQVRNLVSDLEVTYLELYMAYRALYAARTGRDAALENWRRIKRFQEAEDPRGVSFAEAQARGEVYRFSSQIETALCDVYRAENRLRYLMGLTASDGRLIRPVDEPTLAKITFDWAEIHTEALDRSVELRRQKWRIKQRELELIASRNFLLPRLDAQALYRWLGSGDHWIDPDGRPVPPFQGSDAFSTLTSGDYQDWQMGLTLSMPIGFRRELAAVRNAELELARERARLDGQELEVSHLLTEAIRNLECNYALIQLQFDTWKAAEEEAAIYQTIRASGAAGTRLRPDVFPDLINAQRRAADAQTAFYRAVVSYNRSILEVHFRKGSLLEYNGIFLAEGTWPDKAYRDAERKRRDRIRGIPLSVALEPLLRQHPEPICQGPYRQVIVSEAPVEGAGQAGEVVPLPEPQRPGGQESPAPDNPPAPPPPADARNQRPAGADGSPPRVASRRAAAGPQSRVDVSESQGQGRARNGTRSGALQSAAEVRGSRSDALPAQSAGQVRPASAASAAKAATSAKRAAPRGPTTEGGVVPAATASARPASQSGGAADEGAGGPRRAAPASPPLQPKARPLPPVERPFEMISKGVFGDPQRGI